MISTNTSLSLLLSTSRHLIDSDKKMHGEIENMYIGQCKEIFDNVNEALQVIDEQINVDNKFGE